MTKYIVLLRGINVSGKNKIAMAELKKAMNELGYADATTYLNSGNIVFSGTDDEISLTYQISSMIKNVFSLDIPVLVISQKRLIQVLSQAPSWWGNDNKDSYDNLIFLLPPLSYSAFYDEMGALNAEYEKAYHYENVVFWSFCRKDYRKTNWWSKTASSSISMNITIRTAGTLKHLATM